MAKFHKGDLAVGDRVVVGAAGKVCRIVRIERATSFSTYRYIGRNEATGREIRFTAAKVRAKVPPCPACGSVVREAGKLICGCDPGSTS